MTAPKFTSPFGGRSPSPRSGSGVDELPRFKHPFNSERKASVVSTGSGATLTGDQSPPRRESWVFAKRLSVVGLLEGIRKPSVVSTHGDLKEEAARKNRRKTVIKWATVSIIFLVGMILGSTVGFLASSRMQTGTAASSTVVATPTSADAAAATTVEVLASGTLAQAQHVKDKSHGNAWLAVSSSSSTKASSSKTSSTSSVKVTNRPPSTSTKVSSTTSSATKATAAAIMAPLVAPQSSTTPSATSSAAWWKPTAGTNYQIMLNQVITSKQVAALPANLTTFETDLWDTPVSTITALHAAGKKVICYFSAGTAENWRSDYSDFSSASPSVLGANLADWAGEKWVDTRSSVVRNVMAARIKMAAAHGCDAVDPDNVDVYGYTNNGFKSALTIATSIDYVTFLANTAHSYGLGIALKNGGDMLPTVLPYYDMSVTESCTEYNECSVYAGFPAANKPTFAIQYPWGDDTSSNTLTNLLITKNCKGGGLSSLTGFTVVLKKMNLDDWVYNC